MVSRRLFFGGTVASLVCVCPAWAKDVAFAVGQVWTLLGADFAEVKITIDRLENWDNQAIVHISVTGLPKRGGFLGTIAHLPFTESALRASVGKLVIAEGAPFPGFEGGYDQWKAANGGVFTIPVTKALAGIMSQIPPAADASSST